MDNKFIVGRAITKVTGQWLLYTLCKAYSPSGDVERVSISNPIVATVTENDFDISDIEVAELDPNIKIIYDELIDFKKTLEANEATRQSAESNRVNAETNRASAERLRSEAETSRINAEQSRADNEQLRVSAENERVIAENLRVEAENKRDSVITKLREDLDANTKADGRIQRSLTALWDLNKGISYRFDRRK